MKRILSMVAAICVLIAPALHAQSKPEAEAKRDEVSLDRLIETFAAKSKKKIIVDPRVRAQPITYGMSSSVNYSELLAILAVNGYAAVESESFIYVLPVAEVRAMPIPTASDSKRYDDNEIVSKVIHVKNIPATSVIPALRPMVSQYAHLSALACANSLIVVDRYANVKRLQNVIEQLDKGEPLKARECSNDEPKK
jgi:general secretion pathway protein D